MCVEYIKYKIQKLKNEFEDCERNRDYWHSEWTNSIHAVGAASYLIDSFKEMLFCGRFVRVAENFKNRKINYKETCLSKCKEYKKRMDEIEKEIVDLKKVMRG